MREVLCILFLRISMLLIQAHKGRDWFALVTNLSPCVGLRVHLWPEKGLLSAKAGSDRVLEVTMKMVQLPSGPAPPQVFLRL